MFAKLWMVTVRRMPHSNQNTQASIESCHCALKCWFVFNTKGLKGWRIDWLVWWLTITITRHYMHTLEMKKKRFHKKQGYGGHLLHVVWKKAILIPLTHVYQPTFESDGAWGVWSQRLLNVIYAMKFSFTEIFCCTCLQTHDIFQMIWSPMMMTKMNILKVMMGSWNLMGTWT